LSKRLILKGFGQTDNMKNRPLMSGLALVVSTFLLGAQSRPPANVSMEVEVNAAPAAVKSAAPAAAKASKADSPDINEIIKTSNEFTNSSGMIMRKVDGLWVSAYETTQEVYREVAGSNPSRFTGLNNPVDSISWNAATAFCGTLNDYEAANDMLPDGYTYALPTQEQWENLASGVPLQHAVTSSGKTRSGTAAVGSLPGKSGIHDLRGNVAEWCADPADGAYRVLRGGSWQDWIEVNLRPEFRVMVSPSAAESTYGFRCVLIEEAAGKSGRARRP
jgi:hypothetical protein